MDKRVMTLATAAAVVLSAVAMPKNPQAAERWFDDLFVQPETLPVTFTYADQGRCGLGGLPVLARHVDKTENGKKGRLVCRLDDEMSVTLEAAWCREFNEVEYTLWFANTGKQPTKTLKDIFVYRGFVDGTTMKTSTRPMTATLNASRARLSPRTDARRISSSPISISCMATAAR